MMVSLQIEKASPTKDYNPSNRVKTISSIPPTIIMLVNWNSTKYSDHRYAKNIISASMVKEKRSHMSILTTAIKTSTLIGVPLKKAKSISLKCNQDLHLYVKC